MLTVSSDDGSSKSRDTDVEHAGVEGLIVRDDLLDLA
jgi:hypothetical protein